MAGKCTLVATEIVLNYIKFEQLLSNKYICCDSRTGASTYLK